MPPGFSDVGQLLIGIGMFFLLMGLIVMLLARLPGLGRLPGDIYIERDNLSCWVPIASSILLSLLLTIGLNLLLWLASRLGR